MFTDATTDYLHSDGYKTTVARRSHIPTGMLFTRYAAAAMTVAVAVAAAAAAAH